MVTIKEKKLNNLQTTRERTHLITHFDSKTYEQLARVSEPIRVITREYAFRTHLRELYKIILTNLS